jgi:phosphoribosylaminoimidazole-succinocarboxamide synthase
VLVVQQLDAITAGDGARRDEIDGKGRIAAKTTARVFRLLNLCGLPTHYLSAAAKTTTTTRCSCGARR